ncbi:MAG: cob(I)yrinic acid a,c-diamide adenosyltransferase [Ktedonobacteraceae bacterium]|nr:cob(I)yrinic acid a,c-diamide adenosyltransferase [Ktedonobacteraceae bacterium]MBO0790781.1 cob(I)yrinic acid a,c-diamide adenosyltransferase [Ktedonobacteraceae bacterium]
MRDERRSIEELSEERRAQQRQELADKRAHRQKGRHGLVIVNTGNGKGKTSAALGMLMRSWGQGMRAVMLQFLKAQTGNWGEIKAARRMGVEIIPLGDGFTWESENLEHDRALAHQCWRLCREKIESGQYDVVIMDEITYPLQYGWLDLEEVLAVLRARRLEMHVILTGRDAPEGLIECADLVTEMREIKHPFERGIMAQKGIEF